MSKEIIRYHNDMNRLNLGAFSSKELDLFFSICYRLKELGTKEIILSFDELKNLVGENSNPKRFKSYINSLNKNLSYLSYQLEIKENVFSRFVLFTNFTTDFNKNTLTIKVNDDFGYFLNNLVKEFTKFELEQFVNLKSSYSKNVFKLLKQWETKKERIFTLEEFKNLLGIPMTYTIDNINRRVLNQIMKELSLYFKDLKLEKIKTGRSITSLKFTWKNNPKAIQTSEDNIINISEKLYETIEKAKRNRFIKPFLSNENIAKLIDKFTNEDQLIKGLNHAHKEIKQEIKHLSYLVKTIETGIEKQGVKIKVVGESLAQKPIIEVAEVIETLGERKEDQVEVESEAYKEFLKMSEEAQQQVEEIVYKEYVKECGQDTKIQKLAFKAARKQLITKYLEARHELRREVIKQQQEEENPKEVEVVEIKKKRELTQSQYECLFQMYLSNIRLTMARENKEIDIEEERKKFDLKNKDTITIIKVKEITREDLLNKFDELNFSYSLEELEEAFELIDVTHTNQELLNVINSTNRELLDSIVENMREFKAGF